MMAWRRPAREAPAASPERPAIFLATVDSLPQPYEIVGLVNACEQVAAGYSPLNVLMDTLAGQAAALGADGVIGIRLSEVSVPGMSRERMLGRVTDHYGGAIMATAFGTAVRLRTPAHPVARHTSARQRAR
jgi:hypothetical protein